MLGKRIKDQRYNMFGAFFKKLKEAMTPKFDSLTPQEFGESLRKPNIQIVDARTKGEVREGAIKGHKNIDVQQSDFAPKAEKLLDKSKPVYVYCKSGMRSRMACAKLCQLGFEEVHNLSGGYMAWKSAGMK